MDRIQIIQEIFSKTGFTNYLEIGCQTGKSFLPIRAKNKTAVDPVFKIPIGRKLKNLIKWPSNKHNRYFTEESDAFFANHKDYLKQLGHLDVVLVDGLHNFRTSLNDVLNSLEYLNPKGLILMHDCYPPNAAAAFPAEFFPTDEEIKNLKGWTGEWCGDVWKSVAYLIQKYPDLLETGVINTDYGLGFVMPKSGFKERNFKIDEKLFAEIDKLTYEDMMKNPKETINLKEVGYAGKMISKIASASK
ncbi:class I SAM-dependent methyltransferase [Aquiflexum sp. TKW24L]|uniref:class I SAM-dependent methyltransferase n=1 Tax=Aquiflexum sp. TKW24L TaxID=2942212 RepID=UPI0020C03629|nr:class I SAM-dependent methyltransferase [Aquiflexum sp. TKW24L]MCL6261442.1 class I SAM-dependent methyltransferase [Aquiflexum sp. TKW24L]